MLPLLHFSRSRVAVSSSSAPAFGAFAPGPSCHPRFHHRGLSSDASPPVFTSRLWAILRSDRNPEVFSEHSHVRAATFVPPLEHHPALEPPTSTLRRRCSRGLPRSALTLAVPSRAVGPVTPTRGRLQHLFGSMHPCALCSRPADRHGLSSRLRSNRRSSALCVSPHSPHFPGGAGHLKVGAPHSLLPPWSGAASSVPLPGHQPGSSFGVLWRLSRVTSVALSPRGFQIWPSSLSSCLQ